jgi:hypothetical protein
MRLKLTLFLLLANVAVFFVLWRLEQPAAVAAPPTGPIHLGDLDRIAIENHASNETIELSRARFGEWRIVKPVEWPANDYAVQPIINQLQFFQQDTSFSAKDLEASGRSLKDYGLDKPGIVVRVWSGARQEELDVGNHTVVADRLYVMNPADGLIRVVSQEAVSSLVTTLDDLRDRDVFTIPFIEAQSLSIHVAAPAGPDTTTQGVGRRVTLVKTDDQWRLDTPVQCPADEGQVNAVIGQLQSLKVERFLNPDEQDPAGQGLANPFMSVELKGDTTTQTLLLGNHVPNAPTPQYYAKLDDSPTVFVVDADLFDSLSDAQDTLRDHHVLNFSPDKVSAVSVDFGNLEVNIQKLESGADPWQIQAKDATGAPAPITADTALMQSLLDDLQDLQAVSFASDAPTADDLGVFGLTDPQRKVTLQVNNQPVTLVLGVRTDVVPVRYYAKVGDSPFVYEIGPEILGKLSLSPLYYRNRTLEALPAAAQVVSLRLTRLNDDLSSAGEVFNYALDSANATWESKLHDAAEPVRDAVLNLRDAVLHFEVESYRQAVFTEHYIDDPSNPTATPWRYQLDAGVVLPAAGQAPSPPQTLTFYFTDRQSGSVQLGGTRQPPAIFNLTQEEIGALNRLTIEQQPPGPADQALRELNQPIGAQPAPSVVPAAPSSPTTSSTPTSAPAPSSAAPAEPASPPPTAPATPAPAGAP